MKRIKILYIIDRLANAGAQLHLIRVLNALDKNKFEPWLCCLTKEGSANSVPDGTPVNFLHVKRIYGISGLLGLLKLIKLIKKEKFDIVQSYLFSENILGAIAGRVAGTPIIITGRRDTGMLREGKWQHILAYRFTNRWVDKVICVSNAVREIVKNKEKLPDEKLVAIYNGVELPSTVNRKPSTESVVGLIANFSWIKGHKDFIEAAKLVLNEVPDTKFLLVGDGAMRKDLEHMAHSEGCGKLREVAGGYGRLQNIIFLGSRSDIPELLATMDVSVNASYSEGMSNTVLESMAAGVPVVATAVDGNLETVENLVTGILVPQKNPMKMAEAIIKILKDNKMAETMGNNARELVAKKFTSEIMVNNMQNLYIDLIKPKIAFIMSQFPETHETFILREMKVLRDFGLKYKIFSLKPCKDKIIHEDAKSLMEEVDYTHLILSKKIIVSNITGFLKNPFKYIGVFAEVLLKNIKSFKSLWKSLAVFPKSVYYARELKRLKINHIHAHWSTVPAISAYIVSKLSGRFYSITAHAWDIFVKTPMLKEKLQKAKFIVTCTNYNRKYLIKELGLPENNVFLNYHGLEKTWFEGKNEIASAPSGPRNDKGLGPRNDGWGTASRNDCHPFRMLAIGRLVEQKGFEYLVEVCGMLKNKGLEFECSIVGEGPLGKSLRSTVDSRQLNECVKLLGAKTQEGIKRLYSESDIFVAPSVIARNGDRDGIPNVILEAMAMGLPVIGTDVSGLPEAIIDEKTGLLVSERSLWALTGVIERLMKDEVFRKELGKRGREHVKEHFDLSTNVKGLIEIFGQSTVQCGAKWSLPEGDSPVRSEVEPPRRGQSTTVHHTPLTANRIKVLYIIWSLEPGGAERVVTELAEHIDRAKFEPYVCCINKPGAMSEELVKAGIPVLYLDKKGKVDFGALWRLIKILRKYDFDVIHTHMFTSNLWGRLANIFAGYKPVVITEHNEDVWKRPINFLIDKALLPFTKNVIFVSEKVKNFYLEKLKMAEERTLVCHNGIDVSRLKPTMPRNKIRSMLGIEKNDILIGGVGRLVPQKDFQNFLLAISKAKQKESRLKAIIIGDGPERKNLINLRDELKLRESVKFLGLRNDMADLYNAMDLMVVPSEREGLSISILEAMSLGIPIIATNVGGNPECITDGKTGLLVPPKNSEALSKAILKSIADEKLLKFIARNAQSFLKERFMLDNMIKLHEKIYVECI